MISSQADFFKKIYKSEIKFLLANSTLIRYDRSKLRIVFKHSHMHNV